eukprot:363014-Chlamydomonas_euryale.AAC.4
MMSSKGYDRTGCSVEVAFGRRRAEGDCGSSKEGYQVWGYNTAGTTLGRIDAVWAVNRSASKNAASQSSYRPELTPPPPVRVGMTPDWLG